jgi:hypothetical protein
VEALIVGHHGGQGFLLLIIAIALQSRDGRMRGSCCVRARADSQRDRDH